MDLNKNITYRIVKNKYFIVSVLFLLYVLIFSQNNLIERYSGILHLRKLQQQKEYYLKIINVNNNKIRELKTDKINLEKFAREEYLMKKTGEDIFVLVKEQKN